MAEQYGVWGEKSFMGRKYMGVVRSHFVIDAAGRLLDAQVSVGPKASVAEALKVLEKDQASG